jgi:hypothetical protein
MLFMQKMQKIKCCLIAAVSIFLSACNITHIPLAYCPASTQGTYTKHTLKVGHVYDDRHNVGDLTNDPREIGEFSWKQSIAPDIYYGVTPITNTIQTSLHMSLEKAGYRLTSVHPDRVLYSRINKVDLNLEGKNNQVRTLYCRVDLTYALVNGNSTLSIHHDALEVPGVKVFWRKRILGEGSIDERISNDSGEARKHDVKAAFTRALDDSFLQLERDKGFNRALR